MMYDPYERAGNPFSRNGRSHEDDLEYLRTNRNSLHFSLCLVLAMALSTILDFLLLGGVTRITQMLSL